MPNPILPAWECIPDGEPRVFGDRVYLYGSHDRAYSADFCDYKLKVWSAPLDNLNEWVCHGHSFHTRPDRDHESDVPWTTNKLFAPDVIEKDGKYYLYAYIVGAKGAIGVSDKPEGPFKLLSTYKYEAGDEGDDGIYNDAGVLVDDDGKVYVYYGFEKSHMNEINPETMCDIVPGSLKGPVMNDSLEIPKELRFYEASSPRKVGDTYYFIYSPRKGSRLAYATSKSPTGPFTYRGYIIDNGVDYPAGNNHGSIACVNGQWYVFYHRMTNASITSRRACVERIYFAEDGSIPTVEMTSLGFEESLNPYKETPAEYACVLKGGCFVTEKDVFTRVVTNIGDKNVIGFKYFDFGEDDSSKTYELAIKIIGQGMTSRLRILADDYENGEEIGCVEVGPSDGVVRTTVKALTGRHAIYFIPEIPVDTWMRDFFEHRRVFEMVSFVFMK